MKNQKLISAVFSLVLFTSSSNALAANLCADIHLKPQIGQAEGSYKALYQKVQIHKQISAALRDPLMEEARQFKIQDDFKMLADMAPRDLTAAQKLEIRNQAQKIEKSQGRREAVKFLVESLYQDMRNELLPVESVLVNPMWTIANASHAPTVNHIEGMYVHLVKRTPPETKSSLLPLPYPIFIPGARFQEGYYWDSYFVIPTMLRTGRADLVRGQIENFLSMLREYGIVGNGFRDYYLTRSQPPLLSQMIRLYVEHELKKGPLSLETRSWLANEVLPLIKKDYERFWMNPETRYDKETGLNHYFDSSNTPRPERHSSDKEEEIAKTYTDVRAEAESGKDFTDAFEGEASKYGSVMLNSILHQVETDLAWLSQNAGKAKDAQRFLQAAEKRKAAMNKYMWDEASGVYRDYHLVEKRFSPIVTADIFLTLHYGIATDKQARQIVANLSRLERDGGLMSSEKGTGKQWDAPYGWAPHHYFAMSGLKKYGYEKEAKRLAQKWVNTVDRIFAETGKIIEKIDAVKGGVPHEDGDKYPTQDGFLWTNGVYMWALTDILGHQLVPKSPAQN